MYINFVYCTYKLYICDVFFLKKTKNRRKHPQKPAKKKNAGLPLCAAAAPPPPPTHATRPSARGRGARPVANQQFRMRTSGFSTENFTFKPLFIFFINRPLKLLFVRNTPSVKKTQPKRRCSVQIHCTRRGQIPSQVCFFGTEGITK